MFPVDAAGGHELPVHNINLHVIGEGLRLVEHGLQSLGVFGEEGGDDAAEFSHRCSQPF